MSPLQYRKQIRLQKARSALIAAPTDVAEKRAAEAMLAAIEPSQQLTAPETPEMIAELGDVARELDQADREDLAELYDALGLAITYGDAQTRADVFISPRGYKCVRGGTRTLTTRLRLSA
jgi:hypothetical protein